MMKGKIKSIVNKLLAALAERLGFQKKNCIQPFDNYSKNNLLHHFFSLLQKIYFIPAHIVDVGANHGSWTREALRFFPDAYFTLVEPQQQLKASIADILEVNPKVQFHAVGAGKVPGTFNFTIVDRDDSCTFLYSKDEASRHGFKQIEVPVVTLNDLLPTTCFPDPDIIKIDAEGLDLDVLSGAADFFGITEIFMVEVAVVNKTLENSALNMLNFMDAKGYRLFDFTDLNRTLQKNALWLAELVFIKKGGFVDNAFDTYAD